MNIKKGLVSISCITYNHAPYIRECLDGFLMQQTSFPFEIVIHDDASTDGTKEIIEEYTAKYPDIFFPKYQVENQYSQGVRGMMARFNFPRCRGKYIALCEGDDYWTDPLKLQKQVDFLESNEEYSICWTKFNKVDFLGSLIEKDIPTFDESLIEVTVDNFFEHYRTWTLTTFFKSSVLERYDFSKFKYSKDNTIFFAAINNSKGRILDFNSACYRIHDSGIWSSSTHCNRYLADFNNYNEIRSKIVYTPSLDFIVKKNLKDIVKSAIGYENNKVFDINIFNKIFFSVLTELPMTFKIRFLKWYIIKLWNISK